MAEYVRITFLPAGSKRRRTCWAIKVWQRGDRVQYRRCDRFGEEPGVPELIFALAGAVKERPATMSPKYAQLDLNAEVAK